VVPIAVTIFERRDEGLQVFSIHASQGTEPAWPILKLFPVHEDTNAAGPFGTPT
jgi:hypothetical protein